MEIINKAVILMAGKGTRMLPATKICPKELFPTGNIPALLYLLKECLDSGISEVCLIISKEKKQVKNLFKFDKKINEINNEGVKLLKQINQNLKVCFVYQGKLKGTGGATYYAKKFTKNQPFLLLSGDDLFSTEKPASLEVIKTYQKTQGFVCGAVEVEDEKASRYGILKISHKKYKNEQLIEDIIEKPEVGKHPSNFALVSRYVLFPEVYKNIKKLARRTRAEIRLPDAIMMQKNKRAIVFKEIKQKYYDLGNELEFIKFVVDKGLENQKINEGLTCYLSDFNQS